MSDSSEILTSSEVVRLRAEVDQLRAERATLQTTLDQLIGVCDSVVRICRGHLSLSDKEGVRKALGILEGHSAAAKRRQSVA